MPRTDRARTGVVLALTSGLLTALAFAVLIFTQIVRISATVLSAASGRADGELAAESGMHWAAGHLAEKPARFDIPRTAVARPDDWQYRDGAEYRWTPDGPDPLPEDLQESFNPSFARGEPWHDADGDGRYSADEIWTDLDGNGRYTAWSGRLRGPRPPLGHSFSIRIDPGPSSRVNVNGGDVGKPWSATAPWRFKGLPADSGNDQLACHLNLLGASLGIRDYTIANVDNAAIKPVLVSDLGAEILSRRPVGGFRSRNDLARALIDGGALTRDQWSRLSPHLALHETRNTAGRTWLDLNGAPRAVLASFWMHRRGGATSPCLSYSGADLLIGGTPVLDPWTQTNWGASAFVFPEEATTMADEIHLAKRMFGMLESYLEVFRTLWESLQGPDGHLCPDDPTTSIPEPALYATEKARILMAASFPDAVTQNGSSGGSQIGRLMGVLSSVGSWEWDPDDIQGNDVLAVNLKTIPEGTRIIPLDGDGYHEASPYSGLTGFAAVWPDRALWLGPIRDFEVSCLAHSIGGTLAVRSADVRILTGIHLNSQEDFENLGTIRTGSDPNAGIRRFLTDGVETAGLSRYDRVQSLPDFSKRSHWRAGMTGFDMKVGALTLAEAVPDFPASPAPTAQAVMAPHADGNETLAGNWLDTTYMGGQDHVRLKGTYPFADDGPDALFAHGDPFEIQPSQMATGTKPLDKCDPCWTGNIRTYFLSLDASDGIPAPLRSGPPPCPASSPHSDLARMWQSGGIEAWVDFTGGTVWEASADFDFGPGLLLPQSLTLSRGETQYFLEWRYEIPVVWEDLNGSRVVDPGDTYWIASSNTGDNRIAWDIPTRGVPWVRPLPDHLVVEWQTLRYVPNRGNLDALEIRTRLRIVLNGSVVHDAVHTFNQDLQGTAPFVPILSRRIAADGRFDSQLAIKCYADQVALYNGFGAGDFRTANPRPCRDRFERQGWYESPLHVLPQTMRPLWAAWTGVASEQMRVSAPQAMRCRLSLYADATGKSGRTDELAGRGGERLDGLPARSFRFRVDWDIPDDDALRDAPSGQGGTGAFVNPPVFEDLWIALAGRPQWNFWK